MKTEKEIFTEIFHNSELNQNEFAEKVGLTQPYISRYLNGQRPGIEKLQKMAKETGSMIEIKVVRIRQ